MSELSDDLLRFIQSSLRSIWALELLLVLKNEAAGLSTSELVSRMRASEQVVSRALQNLDAAGLVSVDDTAATYTPLSPQIATCVEQLEKAYSVRPDAVRRAIVSTATSGATAFANAFKLRKD